MDLNEKIEITLKDLLVIREQNKYNNDASKFYFFLSNNAN